MIGEMVAQLQEHLGPRMSHVQMGDSGICMLRVAISEEEADKTESMALTQTEIPVSDEGCCHRTSGGLTFTMTVLRSKGLGERFMN